MSKGDNTMMSKSLLGMLMVAMLSPSAWGQMPSGPREAGPSPYPRAGFTAKCGDAGAITLWNVAQEILGTDPLANKSGMKAQVSFAAPMGGNINFELDQSQLNEMELKKVCLGDVLLNVFSRPRQARACYQVCVFGVCVQYCG